MASFGRSSAIYNWGEIMTKEEIIAGLLDNAQDRRALISPDDHDSIFEHDAQVMEEAVSLIVRQERQIAHLLRRRSPLFHRYKGKRLKEG